MYAESSRLRIETRTREWALEIVNRLQKKDGSKFPPLEIDSVVSYNRALSLTTDNLEELRLATALFLDELAGVYELTGAAAEGPELTPDSQLAGVPAAAPPIATSNSFEPLSDTPSGPGDRSLSTLVAAAARSGAFQTSPPRSGAARIQKTPPRNPKGTVLRCVWCLHSYIVN